jgi:hypothetical protein
MKPSDFIERAPAREPAISSQWIEFIKFCNRVGFGRIERLEIQNGQPLIAEVVTKRVKFT